MHCIKAALRTVWGQLQLLRCVMVILSQYLNKQIGVDSQFDLFEVWNI